MLRRRVLAIDPFLGVAVSKLPRQAPAPGAAASASVTIPSRAVAALPTCCVALPIVEEERDVGTQALVAQLISHRSLTGRTEGRTRRRQ